MSLYEVEPEVINCVKVDEDSLEGKLDLKALADLNIERNRKIENLALWYKNLLAEAAALKIQKDIFGEREQKARNMTEKLQNCLLELLDGEGYESLLVTMQCAKKETVDFDSSYILDMPERFLKFKEPELDETAVKNAIKSGIVVPGCSLVERQYLQIK